MTNCRRAGGCSAQTADFKQPTLGRGPAGPPRDHARGCARGSYDLSCSSHLPPDGGPDKIHLLLRNIPAMDRLLDTAAGREMESRFGRGPALDALNRAADGMRRRLLAGEVPPEGAFDPEGLAAAALHEMNRLRHGGPRRVINATGVVLHTNLGRAVLSRAVMERVAEAATGYTDLEFDLADGGRGSRHGHTEDLLKHLTGAPAAIAVNNNAAAVLLALAALAAGRNVIVSRGELVEIGGSFRIPEVMAAGGARLVEVGTTNRTRAADYEAAIDDDTALLLKVHTSNYRIVGFTEETSVEELARLGRRHGIPVMYDMGSGSLADWSRLPVGKGPPGGAQEAGGAGGSTGAGTGADPAAEPTVQNALAAGADLVTFSGDKLLGGPQAGILAGREDLVEACRRHPLARAVRMDKMAIAALAATLAEYLEPGQVFRRVPALTMLTAPGEELAARARRMAAALEARLAGPPRSGDGGGGAPPRISVVPGVSRVGGGSMPGSSLPTELVAVHGRREDGSDVFRWERRLLGGAPPVAARAARGRLLFDLRTVLPEEEEALAAAIAEAITGGG